MQVKNNYCTETYAIVSAYVPDTLINILNNIQLFLNDGGIVETK